MNLEETREKEPLYKIANPKFHKAFCVKPGFRYSALKAYCEKIEFITDGFSTDIDILSLEIAESLKEYDPDRDCIIPTGTGIVNILVGYYLSAKFPTSSIAVAFFQKESTRHDRTIVPEDYNFYRFYPSLTMNL